MRCCLHNPTFSRFSRTPTCDRQSDRHRIIAYTAVAQPRAVIIKLDFLRNKYFETIVFIYANSVRFLFLFKQILWRFVVSKATEVYANDLSGVTLLWKYENCKMCAIPRLWATVFVTISIAINWLQFSDRLAFHRSHDSKITTTTTTIQLQLRLLFVCLFIDPHQETFLSQEKYNFKRIIQLCGPLTARCSLRWWMPQN